MLRQSAENFDLGLENLDDGFCLKRIVALSFQS